MQSRLLGTIWSCVVKILQKKKPIVVEEFIDELEQTTRVSKRFIEAARPILERLYSGVPADRRSEVLETFRQTMNRQAETEASVARALVLADKMGNQQINVAKKLEQMKKRMQNRHAEVASILIRSCGGFGDQQPAFEA